MKIAYLANIRFPSERAHAAQIAHMCEAFVEGGHEVDLFVSTRKGTDDRTFAEYYGFTPSFSIQRCSIPPFVTWGKLFFLLTTLIFSISALPRVLRGKYDLIYARDEWIARFYLLFVPRECLIWESHEAKYNYAARILLHSGVKTVVISEGIRDAYVAKGVPEQQLLVAHDGIDESFFGEVETKAASRARLDLPQDKLIAMYIGGFDRWKGVETFFAAADFADDVLFVAIGGSADEMARYREEYPKVRFLGARPYHELKDNQQAADVLVIPNTANNDLSARFTSPLKLFAHMASGVPIVASDIPSIRNVVNEHMATFVAPDQSTALGTGITTCITSKEVADRAHVAKAVARQYSWKVRAEKVIRFAR